MASKQTPEERAALNEKKIQRVLEWLEKRGDTKVLRYAGYNFLGRLSAYEVETLLPPSDEGCRVFHETMIKLLGLSVLRDADLVQWYNDSANTVLKTACEFDEAMKQLQPESLHLWNKGVTDSLPPS